MNEFVNRVLKPVSIPLIAAVFVGILVYAFSRILLAVPEAGSTSLAMLLAAEVLGVASVLAAARRIKPGQKAMLLVLGLALIAGGGGAAAIGERDIGEHGDEHETAFTITAKDVAFDTATLQAPAGEPFAFEFDNQDAGVQHNVAIYRDETLADALFVGEIFPGPEAKVYEVEGLEQGAYYFHCDVHPTMNGTIAVGEAPAGPVTSLDVVAKNIKFDTDLMVLAADTEITIDFENQDIGVLHNVAIYPSEAEAGPDTGIFIGEIFPGLASRTYTVPATPAGEYYFRCDVHFNMEGVARFE